MTKYLVLLKSDPFYVKCLDEKEALEVATEYKDILICVAASNSHITVKKPEMTMSFNSECDIPLDDYLGERLIDELREVEISHQEVLGKDSVGYLTQNKGEE